MAAISKILGTGLILLLIGTASFAQKALSPLPGQSRSELEKERAALRQEISSVKRSLNETHQHRRQSLAELTRLQHQLALRESAIRKTNAQVRLIRHTMDESGQKSVQLQRQLDSLRNRYATDIVSAYKDRSRYDYLSFIFAASSFNEALIRMQYLRSYKAYCAERTAHMRQEEQGLQNKINELKAAQLEKESVLKKENITRMVLGAEKKEKRTAVARLQSQEQQLEKQIAARQRQDRKLAALLAAVITRAKNERRHSERLPATTEVKNRPVYSGLPTVDNRSDLRVSATFEKSRGHLPWPVDSRDIAMPFGPHVYPNGIHRNNLGLTLSVTGNSPVKAVFDGEVQAVLNIEDVQAVIIRHGDYYTTYSNLSETSVTKGERVKMGQVIGHVAEIGQLEFLISDEMTQWLDPEKWLRR